MDAQKQYTDIPKVENNFNTAVKVANLCDKAMAYWKEEKDCARFEKEQVNARIMLKRWQHCLEEAQAVIQSRQMALF